MLWLIGYVVVGFAALGAMKNSGTLRKLWVLTLFPIHYGVWRLPALCKWLFEKN